MTTRIVTTLALAEADLKTAAKSEAHARAEHEAAVRDAEQARGQLTVLAAMDAPTPQSLAEEEATRRKLAKLDARARDLGESHSMAVAHFKAMESARDGARRDAAHAELDAEGRKLEEDAAAFSAQFRTRLEALQAKARPAMFHSRVVDLRVNERRPEETLAECIGRARIYAEADAKSPASRVSEGVASPAN